MHAAVRGTRSSPDPNFPPRARGCDVGNVRGRTHFCLRAVDFSFVDQNELFKFDRSRYLDRKRSKHSLHLLYSGGTVTHDSLAPWLGFNRLGPVASGFEI